MGIYVNPGNAAFQRINNSEYVDKTKLIDLINARIGTNNNLVHKQTPPLWKILCCKNTCSLL